MRDRIVLSLLCWLPLLLAGCGSLSRENDIPQDRLQQTVRFYWPYAAMATDVYRTRGLTESHTAMALASPWLREQILALPSEAQRQAAFSRLDRKHFSETDAFYLRRLEQRCDEERRQHGLAEGQDAGLPNCAALKDARQEGEKVSKQSQDEPNEFVSEEPKTEEDCKYDAGHKPRLLVSKVQEEPYGWTRVPELQRQTAARAWRLFVPELAIDVWRRTRKVTDEAQEIEYAIVYRGTVGGGGWVSNLRTLTSMLLPIVWDQYQQADVLTDAIIDQIDRLHTLADSVLGQSKPTRLRFTAVGHSLGGGLAQYVYLRTPRITRVVAFDPSPVDGSSSVPIQQRPVVTALGTRDVDIDPDDEQHAAIHVLYEKGEFISLIAPCHRGEIWGDEGGPKVRCARVNYAKGNAFRQHNMAQLACYLYLEAHSPSSTRPLVALKPEDADKDSP